MPENGDERYPEHVRRKADRMLRARGRSPTFWSHLAHVGILGFVFVLPVLAGAFAGRALARLTGMPGIAVASILLGVALGAFASWRQIQRSLENGRR